MHLLALLACQPQEAPPHPWMMVHRCLEWGTENSVHACSAGMEAMLEPESHLVGMETDWCWAEPPGDEGGPKAPQACHECGNCPASVDEDPLDWDDYMAALQELTQDRPDALFVVELKDTGDADGQAIVERVTADVKAKALDDNVVFSAFDAELRALLREEGVETAQNAVTRPVPLHLEEDPYLIINTGSTNGAQLFRMPAEVDVILYNVDTPHTRGHAFDLLHGGAVQYIMANSVWTVPQ